MKVKSEGDTLILQLPIRPTPSCSPPTPPLSCCSISGPVPPVFGSVARFNRHHRPIQALIRAFSPSQLLLHLLLGVEMEMAHVGCQLSFRPPSCPAGPRG